MDELFYLVLRYFRVLFLEMSDIVSFGGEFYVVAYIKEGFLGVIVVGAEMVF